MYKITETELREIKTLLENFQFHLEDSDYKIAMEIDRIIKSLEENYNIK